MFTLCNLWHRALSANCVGFYRFSFCSYARQSVENEGKDEAETCPPSGDGRYFIFSFLMRALYSARIFSGSSSKACLHPEQQT